jgi:ATPase subunit of ABC transporter with duplicated ATPase domains
LRWLFLWVVLGSRYMQHLFHAPILINQLTLNYANKDCISIPFDYQIYSGMRIAIIGRNGSGKSSLLQAIVNHNNAQQVYLPDDVLLAYVPQLVTTTENLSGGERFNKVFSKVLAKQPNLLLLDEPTNHLDSTNRKSLMNYLSRYAGTLIIITHDIELLKLVDTIWHVNNGRVVTFNGSYTDYKTREQQEWDKLTNQVKELDKQKKQVHYNLMKEQERAKKRKAYGERKYNDDKRALRAHQGQGELTKNKNQARINDDRSAIQNKLHDLYIPEVIIPKFNLPHSYTTTNKLLINIDNGSCSYDNHLVLDDLNWGLSALEKCAVLGNNGSGKSTFLKAILNDANIIKTSTWLSPAREDIGYFDQHYAILEPKKTAVELIQELQPQWTIAEIRNHLNTFLLRKNEEVLIATQYLSGGARVRLSLAMIAAKPPKLLILDEISNNLDLETKEHVSQVLKSYPGSLLMVDHDHDFLMNLNLDSRYRIHNRRLLAE